MILDTEFLISLRAEESEAVTLATDLEAEGIPTRIPTVVIQELYVGVGAGSNADKNIRAYESLLANKPIVKLTETISRRAGIIEGQHLTSDNKPTLGTGDAIIAATGLIHSEPVITNDTDFDSVEDLEVKLY